MNSPLIDTNVFLRHLTGEPKDQAIRSSAFIQKLENGEIKGVVTLGVIFEVVFTLERFYKLTKSEICEVVLPLFEFSNIKFEGKQNLKYIFSIYSEKNISFIDAYHVVFMEKEKISEIISFDQDFDKISTIKRIEP